MISGKSKTDTHFALAEGASIEERTAEWQHGMDARVAERAGKRAAAAGATKTAAGASEPPMKKKVRTSP